MSDLLKVMSRHQFNWTTSRPLWDPAGYQIECKDGLKKPDWIKIIVTMNRKEFTRTVVPEQAHVSPEFFIHTDTSQLWVKVVLHLSANKQCGMPTLFPLMEWCFQEIWLTEWKNVISAYCQDEENRMFKNFVKCQQNYVEALAGFPNIDNQLILWFHMAWNLALNPMHNYMRWWVQLFGYLKMRLLWVLMELPMKQENIKQIFLDAKKASTTACWDAQDPPGWPHTTHLFLEQGQNADPESDVLNQLAERIRRRPQKVKCHQNHQSTWLQPTQWNATTWSISHSVIWLQSLLWLPLLPWPMQLQWLQQTWHSCLWWLAIPPALSPLWV